MSSIDLKREAIPRKEHEFHEANTLYAMVSESCGKIHRTKTVQWKQRGHSGTARLNVLVKSSRRNETHCCHAVTHSHTKYTWVALIEFEHVDFGFV